MRNYFIVLLLLIGFCANAQTTQDSVKTQPLSQFDSIEIAPGVVLPVQFVRNDSSLWAKFSVRALHDYLQKHKLPRSTPFDGQILKYAAGQDSLTWFTPIVDSTRLVQDSILVHYQNGVELGRDTLATSSGGSSGPESDPIYAADSASLADTSYVIEKVNAQTQVFDTTFTSDGANDISSTFFDAKFADYKEVVIDATLQASPSSNLIISLPPAANWSHKRVKISGIDNADPENILLSGIYGNISYIIESGQTIYIESILFDGAYEWVEVNKDNGVTQEQVFVEVPNVYQLTQESGLTKAFTTSYFPDSTYGSGRYVWDANASKSTANGGSIIDPSTTGGWDGIPANISVFLSAQGTGVGTGVWVLEGNKVKSSQAGFTTDLSVNQRTALSKAVTTLEKGEVFEIESDFYVNSSSLISIPNGVTILGSNKQVTVNLDSVNNSLFELQDSSIIQGLIFQSDLSRLSDNIEGPIIEMNGERSSIKDSKFLARFGEQVEINEENNLIETSYFENGKWMISIDAGNTIIRNTRFFGGLNDGVVGNILGDGIKGGGNLSNLQVKDCYFDRVIRDGIDITGGCNGCQIQGNIFNNNGTGALDIKYNGGPGGFGEPSSPVHYSSFISNNTMIGSAIVFTNDHTELGGGSQDSLKQYLTNWTVSNNNFIGVSKAVFSKGIGNLSILGNQFYDCGQIIDVGFTAGTGSVPDTIGSGLMISNNIFRSKREQTGEFLILSNVIEDTKNITITDNIFQFPQLSGSSTISLFSFQRCEDIIIDNNQFQIDSISSSGLTNFDFIEFDNSGNNFARVENNIVDIKYGVCDICDFIKWENNGLDLGLIKNNHVSAINRFIRGDGATVGESVFEGNFTPGITGGFSTGFVFNKATIQEYGNKTVNGYLTVNGELYGQNITGNANKVNVINPTNITTDTLDNTLNDLFTALKDSIINVKNSSLLSRVISRINFSVGSTEYDNLNDTITNGWGLRPLTSSYSGPLIRVRKKGTTNEIDIYPGYDGWVDTVSLVNFGANDSLIVSKWYDQFGNADHTQTRVERMPLIYNGSNVMRDERGNPVLYVYANDLQHFEPVTVDFTYPYSVVTIGKSTGNIQYLWSHNNDGDGHITRFSDYAYETSTGTDLRTFRDAGNKVFSGIEAGSSGNGTFRARTLSTEESTTGAIGTTGAVRNSIKVLKGRNDGALGAGVGDYIQEIVIFKDSINTSDLLADLDSIYNDTILLPLKANGDLLGDGSSITVTNPAGGTNTIQASLDDVYAAIQAQTGTGTPAGSITPRYIGDKYIDTTTPGSEVGWLAVGTTNTDWKQITN